MSIAACESRRWRAIVGEDGGCDGELKSARVRRRRMTIRASRHLGSEPASLSSSSNLSSSQHRHRHCHPSSSSLAVVVLVSLVALTLIPVSEANDWCTGECGLFCKTAETVSAPRTDCFAYFDSVSRPCSSCLADTANTTHCFYEVDNFGTSNPPVMRLLGSQPASTPFTTRFNADHLYISWNEPIKYQEPTAQTPDPFFVVNNLFTFPGANDHTTCLSIWQQSTPDEDTTNIESCFNRREIFANWAALDVVGTNPCGLVRSVTPDFVSFALETRLNYVEQLDDTRDTVGLFRSLAFSMPVEIRFPSQINVTSTFRAFSPIFLITTITEQEQFFVGSATTELDSRLRVRFHTSLQSPFDLTVAVDDGVISTPTEIQTVPQGVNGILRVSSPECLDDAPCEEDWDILFAPLTTDICTFTGTYQLNMTVTCSPPGPSSDGPYFNTTTGLPTSLCPVDDNTDDVVLFFNLATSNFCPSVVSNIELNAQASTYIAECPDPTSPSCSTKLGYLHSQVVYLTAQVWSDEAAIERTQFRRCDLTKVSGTGSETMHIYDRDFLDSLGTNVGFYNFNYTDGGAVGYGERSYPRFEFIVDTVDDVSGDGTGSSYDPSTETSATADLITIDDPDLSPVAATPNILRLPADGNAAIDISCIIDVTFQFAGTLQGQGRHELASRKTKQITVTSSLIRPSAVPKSFVDEESGAAFRELSLVESDGEFAPAMTLFADSAVVGSRFSAIGPTVTTAVTTAGSSSSTLSTTVLVYVGVTLVAVVSLSGLALVLSRERRRRSEEEQQLRALYGDAYVDSLQRGRIVDVRKDSVSEQDIRDVSYSESCSSSVIGGVTVYV